jgi:hypothetical protein
MTEMSFILIFGVGVIAEAVFLTREALNLRNLLIAVSLAVLVGFVVDVPTVESRVAGAIFAFALIIVGTYRDAILPIVTEATMVAFNVVFLFLYFDQGHGLGDRAALDLAVLVPSFVVAVSAFTTIPIRRGLKFFFYVWFLSIVVMLSIWHIGDGPVGEILRADLPSDVGVVSALVGGMAAMFLFAHGWYLLALLPIPNKEKSWSEAWDDAADHANALINKFSDRQTEPLVAAALAAGSVIILWVNKANGWLPQELVIGVFIVGAPQILNLKVGPDGG